MGNINILEYTDADDITGYGQYHGKIASPQGPCGYDITPNGGKSQKGGEKMGPFGQYMESPNDMMGVARDGLTATPTVQGGISTPMDTSKSEMPGVTGSSGSGPNSGGGAKISTPWTGPWGNDIK